MAKLREVEGGRGSWKEVREVEVDSFFVEEICLLVDKICALRVGVLNFAMRYKKYRTLMKKVFVGLLLAMSMQAMADDYGYLTFTKGDGSARSLAVDGLTITFADGKATVQNATESETFTLSDLAKMFFSVDEETTMGISLTPTPSPTGEGSNYYSLDGLKLSGKPTKTGVYIVKSNGVTKKIAVK